MPFENAQEIHEKIKKALLGSYPDSEIQSIAAILLKEKFGISRADVLSNSEKELDANDLNELESIIERLRKYEPVQHILGFCEFFGHRFAVNSDVLIPRQETEELVYLVLDKVQSDIASVLDIGTGSGVIPISVALEKPFWNVTGWDISPQALDVARKNNDDLGARVTFEEVNVFQAPDKKFDIIVSNPPYVLESEKSEMSANVLNYDPALALFVPDDDPLKFYSAIAEFADRNLNPEGAVFCEINERLGEETLALFNSYGFSGDIRIDLNGKDRFIAITRSIDT